MQNIKLCIVGLLLINEYQKARGYTIDHKSTLLN